MDLQKITSNPYIPTQWRDHIVDITTGDVIQDGTRFTASRANNIEQGIYGLFGYVFALIEEDQKIRVQLEMVGRSPLNNGTFFDTLSDQTPKALVLQKEKAVVQHAYTAGTALLQLDKAPFVIGQFITIYDDENREDVMITDIDSEAKTVSVTALTKAFKKGAVVARTDAVIDTKELEIVYGKWGNYQIEVSEVV